MKAIKVLSQEPERNYCESDSVNCDQQRDYEVQETFDTRESDSLQGEEQSSERGKERLDTGPNHSAVHQFCFEQADQLTVASTAFRAHRCFLTELD